MSLKVDINTKVANFVREKRLALGMSQREFAIHVFDNPKMKDWICRIENGKPITLTSLERILERVNADIKIIEH